MTTMPDAIAETIHRRTTKGQWAVVARASFGPAHDRLLRMVNGFTPSEFLIRLASDDPATCAQALADLEHQGYIEST